MQSRAVRNAVTLRLTSAFLGLALAACGGALDGSYSGKATSTDRDDGPPVPGGQAGSPGGGGAPRCEDTSAPALFKNALCLCGSYDAAGNLGVSGKGSEPGVFGINGHFAQLGNALVNGTLIVHQGISAANLRVTGSMRSNTSVNVANLEVGGNLYVGTNLLGVGLLAGGGVWVGGQSTMIFNTKPIQKYTGDLSPPCACGADQVLDVAAAVAAARTKNDNASNGLGESPALLTGKGLVLNSGSYYFKGGPAAVGNQKLLANGSVKIYVDGDLESVGNESIEITEGTILEMYVAGNVASVGNLVVGDRFHPAAFRLYVGGAQPVEIRHVGNKSFRGAIYAPRAAIKLLGNVEIEGALFADTIADAGNLRLTFARPSHGTDGKKCVPPSSTSPGPADDPDFDDTTPGGQSPGSPGGSNPGSNNPGGNNPGSSPGAGGSGSSPGGAPDFDDHQHGDPPPNKDGLPDPADLPIIE
jgi:hypothetical protein